MTQEPTSLPNESDTPSDTVNDISDENLWREKLPEIFTAIDQLDDSITRNQAEIDRLKAETRSLFADLQAIRFTGGCTTTGCTKILPA